MGISLGNSAVKKHSGIADALFTTTQKRLLALLLGHPERSFYATELIEKTGSGSGAVQRELRRLVEAGILEVTRIGNQKHYQANAASPVFEELRSIVTKTVGLADPIREALLELGSRLELAVLYGSIAKGSATATSDVDLLVVSDDLQLEELYSALREPEERLGREIHATLYTADEFAQRRADGNEFLKRLFAGPHVVLLGDENAEGTAG